MGPAPPRPGSRTIGLISYFGLTSTVMPLALRASAIFFAASSGPKTANFFGSRFQTRLASQFSLS